MQVNKIWGLCLGCLTLFGSVSADEDVETVFTEIYDHAVWGFNEEGVGFSGGGSTPQSTAEYVSFLKGFIEDNKVKSIVDVGCGDWSFSRFIDWRDINYIGIDVVRSVIERNQASFGSPNIIFIHADGVYSNLPTADLMVCKDVLEHLSNESIFVFLGQLGVFKHCLITNDVNPSTLTSDNINIASSGCRTLDLTKPPFNAQGTKIFTYKFDGVVKQILYIENNQ